MHMKDEPIVVVVVFVLVHFKYKKTNQELPFSNINKKKKTINKNDFKTFNAPPLVSHRQHRCSLLSY